MEKGYFIYFKQILDSSQEAIAMANNEGNVFYINQEFTNFFGYTLDNICGKKLLDFVVPEDMQDEYWFLTNKLINGEKIRYTSVREGKEGKLHVEIIGSPLIIENEQKGFFVIYRDITVYKDTEDRLAQANQQLKDTTAHLVHTERMTALGELTAGIAHELNQPLNNIKIICQDILRDINKDRLEIDTLPQSVGDVVGQINKMAKIIDHMRIFTRRPNVTYKEEFSVNRIIENTFMLIGEQLRVHNIEVIKDLETNLPSIVGNPIGLEQVFTNLLINARDAVESRGSGQLIEIKSSLKDEQIIVSFKNNGGSIPLTIRNQIFEPFFTTKEPGKGTGLGLSISKKLLEEHGGKLVLEDGEEGWAEFTIILPTTYEKEGAE